MLRNMSVSITYSSVSGMDLHTISGILHSKAGFTSVFWIQPMKWGRACLVHVYGIRIGCHDIALQVSIMPPTESKFRSDHRIRGCGIEHGNKRCDQSKDA